MEERLFINQDGSERIVYLSPDFPVHIFDERLSRMANYACGCHWHEDFEILIAGEGELDYFVNGQVFHLCQGQGIFANSRRLHYGFSSRQQECRYYGLVFHPSILGQLPLPMARYAQTLGEDGQEDCLLLDPRQDREVIQAVQQILTLARQREPLFELGIQGCCGRILRSLWARMDVASRRLQADPAWIALRQMTGFIQLNFHQPIRLDEIAAAGAVCRSKCCRLFRERMGCSPVNYLNRYRLERAAHLLREPGMSITEISQACGFDSPSYFSESFRRAYGMSPRDLRGK